MAGQPTVVWRTKALTTSRDPFPPVATRPTSHATSASRGRSAFALSTMVPSMPIDYYLEVHFPIQSPPFAGSPAFLPTAPAGGAARRNSRRSSQPQTKCRGCESEVDTQSREFQHMVGIPRAGTLLQERQILPKPQILAIQNRGLPTGNLSASYD